ncbi:MAG: BON domain-containing protein [Acidobacteriaceae bacterium]|nr:BON domain-containing protein [Acidobacteriaceae bacterium]
MHGNFSKALGGAVLSGVLLFGGGLQAAVFQNSAPDNTRANRDTSQPTADQGKNNMSDRDLEKNIRREVVKDKSLSTYGKNVKIVAQHGTVTLRGPVHSEDEKRAVEEHARKYAGDGHVNNEITVKGDRT